MIHRSAICWCLFFGLIFLTLMGHSPLQADDFNIKQNQSSVRSLTLDQSLGIAMEQNRDIQKAREYSNWVYGKYLEERAQALPQIALNSGAQRQYERNTRKGELSTDMADPFIPATVGKTTDAVSYEVSVTQPLYTWGKLSAAIRAAKLGLGSAEQQLRLYRQAAIRDVTAAFYDVLLTKSLATIAEQSLDQRHRHWQEAQKKFALGTATSYDVLAAQVATHNARPDVIRAQNAIRLACNRLQFLLGASSGPVDAVGSLDVVESPLPSLNQLIQMALRQRPEVQVLDISIGINAELVNIAKAGNKPNVAFSGTFGEYTAKFSPNRVNNDNWTVAVLVNIPIFDGFRTKGQVSQSRSDLASSRLDLANLKESISIEAQIALDQVQEAQTIIAALKGTVNQAEELLSMAEKGFEYGVKTRLDVQDAQLNLAAAEGNLAQACRDYLVALTHLQWVQGTLGETIPPENQP